MRLRPFASIALFGLLASLFGAVGMAIHQTRTSAEDSGTPPVFTTADCTFFKEGPDKFLGSEAQYRADLSRVTQMVSAKVGHPVATGDIGRKSFIDNYIFDKMAKDGVQPANLSTDAEFMRRVTLDLTGRIPTDNEVRAFLASTSPTKRDDLVNHLIGSPEFVDRWTMFFGDLFKNTAFASNVNRYVDGRTAFYNYIRNAVAQNKPYNQVATDLISAAGDSFSAGQANFVVGGVVPMGPAQDIYDGQLVQTANVFLGINVFDCLLCHNGNGHLNQINVWGTGKVRMDAWHMSAFFSRTSLQTQTVSQQPRILKWMVGDRATGNYQLGTTSGNRVARVDPNGATSVNPTYIFNGNAPAGSNFRVEFAKNLTNDIQFARAAVNYLWAQFFSLGMVDPPNTFDLARLDPNNPPPAPWALQPTHPELLNALAQEFIHSGYNLQDIMRLIAQSNAYQLSSRYDTGTWSDSYVPYFARHFTRRLRSEEMHDAIAKATGVLGNYTIPQYYNGSGYATTTMQWAMQLPDTVEPGSNRAVQVFLNTFLRGDRDQKLRSNDASILEALGLMNNNFIISRIHYSNSSTAQNLVSQLLNNSSLSNSQRLDELFLSTLSRFPTDAEKTTLLNVISSSSNPAMAFEDIQWALLNKVDFIYNY